MSPLLKRSAVCLAGLAAGCGGVGQDVQVDPPNVAPAAAFGSACVALACTFTDSSTDADGRIAAYRWSFGDGSEDATTRDAGHAYAAPGDYTVALRVTDDSGATDSTSAVARAILPPNRPPQAAFGSDCEELACTFTDLSFDPDGQVVASRWSFGDGSPDTTARYVAHAYTAPGTYTVVLTVTDDRGGWAAVSHSVEAVVSNSPPQAGFTSACAGLTCTFSDGSFDYDGTVVGYHWTFGDGESADGPHPVHTYAAPGVYHVQLVVTDDRGATGEAAQDVPAASPDDPVIGLVGAGLRFCVPFSGGSTRVCGARGAMGINNLGGGTLHWTATKSGAWLRILPQSGTTLPGMQSGMQVWVVDSGVAPGFYLGWIKISATGVINSPQTMPVYFTKR